MSVGSIDIAANLAVVRERIARAASRTGRDPSEVTLVAVGKLVDEARIRTAYAAGQRHFGENRVQEAEAKIAALSDLGEAHWHLVGHLQTNKTKAAVRLFDVIQSVDSIHVAQAISRQAVVHGRTVPVLLEVNVAGEATKFGFGGGDVPSVAAQIVGLPNLAVEGLMTVAPPAPDAEEVRLVFRALRMMGDTLRRTVPQSSWRHLSMGMTDDFEVAVEEGATIVRIGRAIFGPRTDLR